MIDIKCNDDYDMLLEQLDNARESHTPVVILFYSKHIKNSKKILPYFDELPSHYHHYNGRIIKFFKVDARLAFVKFEIEAFPTVVAMKWAYGHFREHDRVVIDETICLPTFLRELKTLLDDCFDEDEVEVEVEDEDEEEEEDEEDRALYRALEMALEKPCDTDEDYDV